MAGSKSIMIIPNIKCSCIQKSITFYTQVLDFELAETDAPLDDPGMLVLKRAGALLFLSSHKGDGVPGQAISITASDVDGLFHKFRTRGLTTPGDASAPTEVHEGPIDQTWGTREFYVDDPDGNTLRFTQGFKSRSLMTETEIDSEAR